MSDESIIQQTPNGVTMPDSTQEQSAPVDPAVQQAIEENKPLPGLSKFWNEEKGTYDNESLAKSYAELQKMLGKKSSEATEESEPKHLNATGEETPEETPAETPETSEEQNEVAQSVVEQAGVDVAKMQETYAETGDISADDREKIAKVLKDSFGLGAEAIDLYMGAQKAAQEKNTNEVLEGIGGVERYNQAISWAEQNYSEGEIDSLVAALGSPDINIVKFAVDSLNSRYTAAEGAAPGTKLSGKGQPEPDIKPYTSKQEMAAVTQDPRYMTDPAFRETHAKRVQATMKRG
jgi:hypothetical protein